MRVPPGSQLVFDQVLTGVAFAGGGWAANSVSDPRFNDWLGKPNDLHLFVTVDRVASTVGSIDLLDVFVEDSGDQETASWARSSEPINLTAVPVGTPTTAVGSDTDASRGRPGLGYRRITIVATSLEAAFSAHIRIWVSGRNGYRKFNRLLLAQRLEGTGIIYAPHESCAWLAGVDQLAVSVLTDEVAGAVPGIGVVLEESPNGRAWNFLSSALWGPTSGALHAFSGVVDSKPMSGFLRVSAQLISTDNAATVRLWVTGRDVRSG